MVDLIRVLITDDHPVMRHGLRGAVATQADMLLVGEAANGREAIEKFRELRPSVALMDLQMPEVDGLDAIGAIRAEFPDANIIVLTSYPGDARIMRALMLGATSYLLKSSTLDEIVRAIRASMAGRHVMDPDVAHDLAAYAGQSVKLRWLYRTDSEQARAGWFVDDIALTHAQVPGLCTTTGELIFRNGFEAAAR